MRKIRRDITFIYSDSAEKSMYEPIAQEAQKRGYAIHYSNNKFVKCCIGFYCQHINYPENSKFSVILLHDIIQQYSNWPDIWYQEPWNKYDVGILPSNQWERNWLASSSMKYSRPRKGVYKVGWPKADVIAKIDIATYKRSFFSKYGLDPSKRTILYAPAWENDGKQDDFVKAIQKLDVNMLIKQAPWDKEIYPEIYNNCEVMAAQHRGLDRVCILPNETNIFEAIAASDVLVSEESSTMCEAAMLGIPAISVSDWLIPDVTPSRFPKCDYDFVTMTVKKELSETTKEILANYEDYKERVNLFKADNFANIGTSSRVIMDIVDGIVSGKAVNYPSLVPKKVSHLSAKKEIKRRINQFKTKAVDKSMYLKRYNLAYKIYSKLFKRKGA